MVSLMEGDSLLRVYQSRETSNLLIIVHLWGESTSSQRIPLTKDSNMESVSI